MLTIDPIIVTYTTRLTSDNRLVTSARKFNWPIFIICESNWKGFKHKFEKVLETREKLKKDYTHVISLDAFDTVIVRSRYEFNVNDDLILAAEKNCWPDKSQIGRYPEIKSPFRFVNSSFCMSSKYDANEIGLIQDEDDQLHLTKFYLNNMDKVKLDSNCEIFQSLYQFDDSNNFTTKLENKITGTMPFFFHGNGKANMGWISCQ